MYSLTKGRAVSAAKSAYASSITNKPGKDSAVFFKTSKGKDLPLGACGLVRKNKLAPQVETWLGSKVNSSSINGIVISFDPADLPKPDTMSSSDPASPL